MERLAIASSFPVVGGIAIVGSFPLVGSLPIVFDL